MAYILLMTSRGQQRFERISQHRTVVAILGGLSWARWKQSLWTRTLYVVVLSVFLTDLTCFSQQTDIRQFIVFGGFSYLSTPSLNLTQRGFDGAFGVNVRGWLTLGGNFSYGSGHSTLVPKYLSASAKAQLAPILPLLPPGFLLAVPYNSSTYTYEAGPQFNYTKLKKVTLFVRPALGALHANVTAKPDNSLLTQIVAGLVGPSLTKSDTVVFYGFGGGISWVATPHFGFAVATGLVHYNLFSNLLDGGRNTVRVTVGTTFSFGKNILQKKKQTNHANTAAGGAAAQL